MDERTTQFTVIATSILVANADGHVSAQELGAIAHDVAASLGLERDDAVLLVKDVRSAFFQVNDFDPDELLAAMAPKMTPAVREDAYRAAVVAALADGVTTATEAEMLDKIAAAFAIDGARRTKLDGDARMAREAWVRQHDAAQDGAHAGSAVDWASTTHAYGPARDVPAQLAALEHGTPRERKAALWALFGNIVHQGSRYPATVPAVAELVRIAAGAPELWKAQIYGLVTACVTGWMSITAGPFTVAGAPWSSASEGDQAVLLGDIERAAAPVIDDAIASLGGGQLLRRQAAYLLASFRERAVASGIVDALVARWQHERDPVVRATLAFAIGHTAAKGQDATLLATLEADEPRLVQVVAAMLLARRLGSGTPTRAVALLGEALGADSTLEHQYTRVPWQTEGLAGDVAEVLLDLGREATRVALPAIERRLARVGDFSAVGLLRGALFAAFGDAQAPDDAAALDDVQRRVLTTLVNNDEGLWSVGNALNVLGERGLPSMRESMARWLGVEFRQNEAEAAIRHARLLRETFEDVPGARAALERARVSAPDHPRLLLELAQCASKSAEPDDALALVDAALSHDASLGEAHFLRAELQMQLGDIDAAIDSFRNAALHLADEPRVTARGNAAALLAQSGRRDEALALLRASVDECPEVAGAWYSLGLSAVKGARYDECIASIDRLLELEPEHANGHYTIACAHALRGGPHDREAALRHVEEALSADPELAESIAQDEDFVSLRDDARFRRLVSRRRPS
jgi:tetratricopeptide (TPR) repeat protein/tellurite resistance protein